YATNIYSLSLHDALPILALITITHENHVQVVQATQQFVQQLLMKVGPETIILGPTPSPIPRIKDRYRYQCMIKYKHEPKLRTFIDRKSTRLNSSHVSISY